MSKTIELLSFRQYVEKEMSVVSKEAPLGVNGFFYGGVVEKKAEILSLIEDEIDIRQKEQEKNDQEDDSGYDLD